MKIRIELERDRIGLWSATVDGVVANPVVLHSFGEREKAVTEARRWALRKLASEDFSLPEHEDVQFVVVEAGSGPVTRSALGLVDELRELAVRQPVGDGEPNALIQSAYWLEEQAELLEQAWGVIANAGGGDWQKETAPWRVAATRWRDRYLGTP